MTRITTKVKVISSILSLMVISIIVSTVLLNQKGKKDSYVINIAGKERMLSQKMSKEIFRLKTSETINFKELDEAQSEFETNFNDLLFGNKERGIYAPPTDEIKRKLLAIRERYKLFAENITSFKELLQDTKKEKDYFIGNNEKLLEISDSVVKFMVNKKLPAEYIDIAGRQRMLTQKMAYHTTRFLIQFQYEDFRKFYEAFWLYNETIGKFVNDPIFKKYPQIQNTVFENARFWKEYSGYITNLIEKQNKLNQNVDYIAKFNTVLLEAIDEVVSDYTLYSEMDRQALENFQYIAAIIGFFVMFYVFALTKNIEDHFTSFLEKSKDIGLYETSEGPVSFGTPLAKTAARQDEFAEAFSHIDHLLGKINRVVSDAKKAIDDSENAAKELEKMTGEIERNIASLQLDENVKKEIRRFVDKSEDIAIQSLEDLSSTSELLKKLQDNLDSITRQISTKA